MTTNLDRVRINGVSVELRCQPEKMRLGLLRSETLQLGLVQLQSFFLYRLGLLQQKLVLRNVVSLVQLRIVISKLTCKYQRFTNTAYLARVFCFCKFTPLFQIGMLAHCKFSNNYSLDLDAEVTEQFTVSHFSSFSMIFFCSTSVEYFYLFFLIIQVANSNNLRFFFETFSELL